MLTSPPSQPRPNQDAVVSPAGLLDVSEGPPDQPHFSNWVTGLAAIVLLLSLFTFVWLHLTIPLLARVTSPEQALALTVGRSLELEEALPSAPRWERVLYKLSMQNGADQLEQAIRWYAELAAYSKAPVVPLQLAILEGEARHRDRVRAMVMRWSEQREPFASYAAWITAAYLDEPAPLERERSWQAEVADTLPAGWFYDKLALRLATSAGDRVVMASASEALMSRVKALLERMRVFLGLDLAMIAVGVPAALLFLRRRDSERWRISTAVVPPQWRGRTGLIVLIRGGAIGAVITWAALFGDLADSRFRLVALPVINLPLLLLAQRYLLQPHGRSVWDGFGLRPFSFAWPRLLQIMAALLAAGFLGEWLIGVVGESLGLSSHWTEWFDEDLVWGNAWTMGSVLLEYVLYAPFFEELLFRALLFATLRRRFGFTTSALLSAGTFGLAHGYGVLGFASVMWSGLLWAWAYEKTGSLLPGVLAHVLNNVIVCLSVIWMLRL